MNLILKPAPQTYQVQTQQHNFHPTLSRVLHGKFLNWVAKTPAWQLLRAFGRLVGLLLLSAVYAAPQFTLGVLTAAARWNGYRLPLFAALLVLTLNAKTIYRTVRRHRTVARGANQHTYHGLPVDELASYLIEQQAFKLEDSMKRFGITQPKFNTIADQLEGHQVLIRGEKNARVLNTITREQLVRQLREKFPLEFHEGEWAERNGSWERHLRDRERQEQKERVKVERLQNRVGKLKAEAQELSACQRLFAPA